MKKTLMILVVLGLVVTSYGQIIKETVQLKGTEGIYNALRDSLDQTTLVYRLNFASDFFVSFRFDTATADSNKGIVPKIRLRFKPVVERDVNLDSVVYDPVYNSSGTAIGYTTLSDSVPGAGKLIKFGNTFPDSVLDSHIQFEVTLLDTGSTNTGTKMPATRIVRWLLELIGIL